MDAFFGDGRAGGVGRPGLRKATTSPACRTRGGEAISRDAEEALFAHAELITEARVDAEGYCGSTMITVDLAAVAKTIRNLDSHEARARFATLASGSVRVRLRALRFACAEAARRVPERPLDTFSIETRMRLEGTRLLIDVDVAAPFMELEREHHG